MSKSRRILVVSDMHVGRDCKEITGFNRPRRPNPEFDQAFIDFLDYYTAGRETEWKLVIDGDFIDFMEVVVAPGAAGFINLIVSFEVTDEEREFGLGSEAERVSVKLEKTFEYHRAFFERLARFVKDGGELVIVRGNHDVEFHWPKVETFFRRRLADLAFANDRMEVDDAIEKRNEFQRRIDLPPWFYYEAGRIYVEHGHQYDVYCSFDHWLHPVSPTNPRRIDTPISAFAMRYLVNLLHDFAPRDVGVWTWRDYWAWLRQKGLGEALWIGRMTIGAAFRALEYSVLWTLGRVRAYSKEHTKKRQELAARNKIPLEKLEAIDHLHHTPVVRNLPELLRLLFLDRVLLALTGLFLTALVLITIDETWLELVGIALVAVAVVRANRYMVPRRALHPGPKQAQAAERIAEILDVPLVVMGHSHGRRDMDLGHGRRYLNTGCWLPPFPEEDHVDAAKPCTCKLSHLHVDLDGKGELRVFCKAQKSVRLTDVGESTKLILSQEREAVHSPAEGLVP